MPRMGRLGETFYWVTGLHILAPAGCAPRRSRRHGRAGGCRLGPKPASERDGTAGHRRLSVTAGVIVKRNDSGGIPY